MDITRIRNPWLVAGTLIVLTVLLRYFSYFISVINHDESTYIVIAREMLAGRTYLLDLIDTKPAGIFLIYAGMLKITGGSIAGLRLLTSVWIGLTSFLLYLLGLRATGNRSVAWAAGLIFPLYTGIWTFYGVSPNTELFYTLFSCGAVLAVWQAGDRHWRYLLAGLLLGMGFVIKYTIAADALAVGLLVLWQGRREGQLPAAFFRRALPMTLVFFLPILLTGWWYYQREALDTFLFFTLEVTRRYPVERAWWERLVFLLEFLGRFLPFTLLALGALWARQPESRQLRHFCWLWLGCTALMVILPGKMFGHYHIQLMPPATLLAASFLYPGTAVAAGLRKWSWRLLAALWLAVPVIHWDNYHERPDEARQVADYLAPLLEPDDLIYPGDFHQILYHLLDRPVLSPYVHSSLLYYDHHIYALEADIAAEARSLFSLQPRFVLLRQEHHDNEIKQQFRETYRLRHTFDELKLELWEKP